MLNFRKLKAEEIDVRFGSINANGASLLLYKDARVDQNILDETVGPMNWQRHHTRENANCTVAIWDAEKQQWIEKEDTGTESNTEKEKGLASDSFKRACVNWGIGRELYTAPFIWVSAGDVQLEPGNGGKYRSWDKFSVTHIEYDGDRIVALSIRNTTLKRDVYVMGKQLGSAPAQKAHTKAKNKPVTRCISETQAQAIRNGIRAKNLNEAIILTHYGIEKLEELPERLFIDCMANLEATPPVKV